MTSQTRSYVKYSAISQPRQRKFLVSSNFSSVFSQLNSNCPTTCKTRGVCNSRNSLLHRGGKYGIGWKSAYYSNTTPYNSEFSISIHWVNVSTHVRGGLLNHGNPLVGMCALWFAKTYKNSPNIPWKFLRWFCYGSSDAGLC